jgi:hypothetical protein
VGGRYRAARHPRQRGVPDRVDADGVGRPEGQLVRFHGDRLPIVRQPAVEEPLLAKESCEVEDIAGAFEAELADALEPPPSARW